MLTFIENGDMSGLLHYAVVRISITLVCWFFMICANLIDFWSGTATAKSLGEALMSHGFRRTITKVGDYWRVMLMALMFDVLGAFLDFYILPFVTILGTIAIICIEGRSVLENSKRKKAHAAEIPEMVAQIVKATTSEEGEKLLRDLVRKITENKHAKNK